MDESTPRRSIPAPLIVVVVVAVAVVVAVVLLLRRPAPETAAVPAATSTAAPVPTPTPEVPQQLVGATLATSDPAVRELAGDLSSSPRLASWLQHQDLVRRFVASVAAVADGKQPRQQLEFLRPERQFTVTERDGTPYLDPASYRRYDGLADVFASLDPARTVKLYRQAGSLVNAAWAEIGPPGKSFDDVLATAIRELLATPVVTGPVPLRRKVVTFAFADPRLEGLSAAQKQLLRLGPDNQRKVQAQLRAIAEQLGVPMERLPAAREITAKPAS